MAVGRPTKMTDHVVGKLEEAFLLGCTDQEACLYADIAMSTLYDYCNKYPSFSERKELLKQNPVMKARKVILKSFADNDVNSAHKFLDRKEGTKSRVENTGKDGGPITEEVTVTFVTAPKRD